MAVVDSSRLSAITWSLGPSSARISRACSAAGMTFVFTSVARASTCAIVWRMVKYIAARTPACNSTASPVSAMNTVIWSITVAPSDRNQRRRKNHALETLGRACLRRGFVVRLTACFVGGAELVLLLIDRFAAPIGPLSGLFTRFAGAASHIVPAILGALAQHFTRLAARTGSVKHPSQSSEPQTRQKPYKTIAVAI